MGSLREEERQVEVVRQGGVSPEAWLSASVSKQRFGTAAGATSLHLQPSARPDAAPRPRELREVGGRASSMLSCD